MKTFYWDFFGPDAAPTAEHFRRHVEELLRREAVEGGQTGTEEAPGRASAWCRVPPAVEEAVVRALRPRRVREES